MLTGRAARREEWNGIPESNVWFFTGMYLPVRRPDLHEKPARLPMQGGHPGRRVQKAWWKIKPEKGCEAKQASRAEEFDGPRIAVAAATQ